MSWESVLGGGVGVGVGVNMIISSDSLARKYQTPAKTANTTKTTIKNFGLIENFLPGGGKGGRGFGISRGFVLSAGPSFISGAIGLAPPDGGIKGGSGGAILGPPGGGLISNGFDSGLSPFLAASKSSSIVRTRDLNSFSRGGGKIGFIGFNGGVSDGGGPRVRGFGGGGPPAGGGGIDL